VVVEKANNLPSDFGVNYAVSDAILRRILSASMLCVDYFTLFH
jgi:hypothetical protein